MQILTCKSERACLRQPPPPHMHTHTHVVQDAGGTAFQRHVASDLATIVLGASNFKPNPLRNIEQPTK